MLGHLKGIPFLARLLFLQVSAYTSLVSTLQESLYSVQVLENVMLAAGGTKLESTCDVVHHRYGVQMNVAGVCTSYSR